MLVPVLIKNFAKSINQTMDKQMITHDEATAAQNLDLTNGNLKRCKGSARYTTASLANSIDCLMKYFNGTTAVLVAVSNGIVYKLNGNTLQAFASGFTSNNFDYVNYQTGVNQIMIFGNGKENVKVYDGVTLRDLKHDGAASAASGTNIAPKGSLLELHKERLFIAGDTSAPNRLYFSTSFDPDDFTAPVQADTANTKGGFIDIPTWDGGNIIALKSLFDQLVVFKTKNIFRLYGTYPGNFEVNQVFNTVSGEIIDKTICSIDNSAYWLSTEGIFKFNGTQTVELTPRIKDEFNKINKAYIKNAAAIIFKNKLYIAVPEGSSTVNNMIIEYDLVYENFMIRRGLSVNSFIEFNGSLIFSSPDGNLYTYNTGDTFNGSLINSFWDSGVITLDRMDKRKYLRSINFAASGSGLLRITLTNEFGTQNIKDISLTSTVKSYEVKLKIKGRLLSFRIENVAGADFELKQPQFNIEIPD